MELSELLKKIGAMRAAVKGRLGEDSAETMQIYVQGYGDGLDWVTATIKKAIEAERTRQRLAKLESELAQEREPAWPELPNGVAGSVFPVRETGPNRDTSMSDRI